MLRRILIVSSSVFTIVFAFLTITRSMMDYNENGVYFDANAAVVYDDDAVVGYGLITTVFLASTAGLILVGRKK